MTKKRIIWASVVVILVIIFGILPKFFGDMARQKIDEQIKIASDIPGYKMEISEYDQGWFSSRIVFSFGYDEHMLEILAKSEDKSKLDDTLLEFFKNGLHFESTVAHGPITFQNGVNFALLTSKSHLKDFENEGYLAFKQQAGIDHLLEEFSTVSYFGTINSHFFMPAFSMVEEKEGGAISTVNVGGLEGKIEAPGDLSSYELDIVFRGASVVDANSTLEFGEMVLKGDAKKLNDYIYLGEGETTLDSIVYSSTTQAPFELKNLKMTYDMEQDSATDLSAELKLSLDRMVGRDGNLATDEFIIEEVEIDLKASRLHIEALTDYVKGVQESSRLMYGAEDPEEQQAYAREVLEIINAAGQKLLLNSPELDIRDLDFKFNGGSFDSDGTVTVNAEGLEDANLLSVPQELTKRLSLDANARFDQALAEAFVIMGMTKQAAAAGMDISAMPPEQLKQAVSVQTTLMMQAYVQQGLIVAGDKENTFKTRIQIKDGQQLINGKAIQLPMQ